MKVLKFLKLLKRKINNYDKTFSNPFMISRPVVIIWVEDNKQREFYFKKKSEN